MTWLAKPPDGKVKLGPVLTCLADVEPRPVAWLWKGRVPLGRITLLVGRPGEGKSFLTTDMAARVTTGTPWPDGSNCPQGSVLMLTAEDDAADTIRPRLDAHYADVRRVHLLSAVRRVDEDGQYERLVTLADLDAIGESLVKLPDCKLVVVDPIGSYLSARTDAHRDNEVRSVLAPIAALAEKYGPTVLVVAHRRKSAGSIADDLALGSRAFTGIARAVWHLARDPGNKIRRLFLPGKQNLSADVSGLAFTIVGDPARIAWERERVEMSADDALAAEAAGLKRGPEARARAKAEALLRDALAAGPRPARDVQKELRAKGVAQRTLERARNALGVVAYQPMVPGPWFWRLPDDEDGPDRQDTPPGSETWRSGKNAEKTALFDPPDAPDRQVTSPQGKPGALGSDGNGRLAPLTADGGVSDPEAEGEREAIQWCETAPAAEVEAALRAATEEFDGLVAADVRGSGGG